MAHKGLREPHLLLASSNPMGLMRNLKGLIDDAQIAQIDGSVSLECRRLYELASSHRSFADQIDPSEWRQKVSRFYYAAYNCRRAVLLRFDGSFSTDASDHQKVDQIPDVIANSATFSRRLKDLREDRNLADYSHTAVEADLLVSVADAQVIVSEFFEASKVYLADKGVFA